MPGRRQSLALQDISTGGARPSSGDVGYEALTINGSEERGQSRAWFRRPWKRRHKWAVALASVLVVLVAAFFIVLRFSVTAAVHNGVMTLESIRIEPSSGSSLPIVINATLHFSNKIGKFFHIRGTLKPSNSTMIVDGIGKVGQVSLPYFRDVRSDGTTRLENLRTVLYVTNVTALGLGAQHLLRAASVKFRMQGDVAVEVFGITFKGNHFSKDFVQGGMGGRLNTSIAGVTIEEHRHISGSASASTAPPAPLAPAVTLQSELVINNPTTVSVVLNKLSMHALYENVVVGEIYFDYFSFDTGRFRTNACFGILGKAAMPYSEDLVTRYLHGTPTPLTLSVVQIESSTSLWTKVASYLDVDLTISRVINGNTKPSSTATTLHFDFGAANVLNVSSAGVWCEFEYSILNPTGVVGVVHNVSFDVIYQGNMTGRVVFPVLELEAGVQDDTNLGHILPLSDASVSPLVQALLLTTSVPITFRGSASGPAISQLLGSVDFPLTIPGIGGLSTLKILSFQITETSSTGVAGSIEVELSNPTTLTGNIGTMSLQVYHDSVYLGNGTANLEVKSGRNVVKFPVLIHPSSDQAVAPVVTAYLKGEAVNITGHVSFLAKVPGSSIPRKIAEVSLAYTVPSTGRPVSVQVENVVISGADREKQQLIIDVQVAVDNPTTIGGTIGTADLDVGLYSDSQVVHLGVCELDGVRLIQGRQVIKARSYLSPDDTKVLAKLAGNFIMGKASKLNFKGSTSSGSVFSALLADYNIHATIAGSPDVLIDRLELTHISAKLGKSIKHPISWTADAQATIRNPLPFTVNVVKLEYDIYFNNTDGCSFFLGALKYPPKLNIFLGTVLNNWSTGSPLVVKPNVLMKVPGAVTASGTGTIERGLRLYHEYYQKHALYLNLFGRVQLELFDLNVGFSFYHEKVH